MGRPKRNNADYFSHDAQMRNHGKIKALRRKFGFEGYALWCMLLELLTEKDGFKCEWDEMNIEITAGDFDIDADRLTEVVEYLERLKLVVIEDGFLFSENHIDRFSGLIAKRNRDNARYEQLKETETEETEVSDSENSVENPVSVSGSAQSKVKESKVKKSKVEESKKEDIEEVIDFFNKTAVSFPSVKLTPNRVKKIRARIKENSKEEVFQMIKNAAGSSFLAGQNKNDWQANFDWLFRPNNFVKVLEGNYNNKQSEVKSQINGESWKRNVLK